MAGLLFHFGPSCKWVTSCSPARRHCPDSRRTFTKRLMLEKHIQLMHGIKDPDLKELTEATQEEEAEIKEDAKVRHHRVLFPVTWCGLAFFHSLFSFKISYSYTIERILTLRKGIK